MEEANTVIDLKRAIRDKIIDIWNNPDNPAEDKLIEIFEYTAEQIVDYVQNLKS